MFAHISRSMIAVCCAMVLGSALPTAAAEGERYAFLVGVREYDTTELNSLRYSESDVLKLRDTLVRVGYAPENITLMTQSTGATKARLLPTRKNVVDELGMRLSILHPEDSILIAFAGHGVQFKGEKQAYFCPMDAKLSDRSTLVPLEAIFASLGRSKAGTKVLLVDACRNDPQSAVSRTTATIELEAVGRPQGASLPGGVAALYSCSDGELAFEHPDLEHGVFFNYVIAALKGEADFDGDKQVSLSEVETFTVRRVQKYVLDKLGKVQTPIRKGEIRGTPTLAFLSSAGPGPMRVGPGGRPSGPSPMPMPEVFKIEGTTWRIEGGGKIKSLVTFRPGGTLVNDKGDGKPQIEKWQWTQGRISMELHAGEYVLEGYVQGRTMAGKGGNRAGEGFEWKGTLSESPAAAPMDSPSSRPINIEKLYAALKTIDSKIVALQADRQKLLAEQALYQKDDKQWQELDALLTANQRDIDQEKANWSALSDEIVRLKKP